MRKVVVASISIALATTTGGCAPTAGTEAGGVRPPGLCALRPTGFFTLAAMLEGGGLCDVADCSRGGMSNIESKELAGYTLGNWLWSGPGPPSKIFTVAEESGFRAAARALAIAARPAGKILIRITYFTDFTVPDRGSTYVLGARGYYGACVPGGNSPPT